MMTKTTSDLMMTTPEKTFCQFLFNWCTIQIDHFTDNVAVTDASDLGLAPGEWPKSILVRGKKETRKFEFLRFSGIQQDEAIYRWNSNIPGVRHQEIRISND